MDPGAPVLSLALTDAAATAPAGVVARPAESVGQAHVIDLRGWDGAAPTPAGGGLAWRSPAEPDRPRAGGLEQVGGGVLGLLTVSRETVKALNSTTVSRETTAHVEGVATGLPADAASEARPGTRDVSHGTVPTPGVVSRETGASVDRLPAVSDRAEGRLAGSELPLLADLGELLRPSPPPGGAAGRVDTRESSPVGGTGQTAPVNAERQDQNGSRLMQQGSSATGSTVDDLTGSGRPYGTHSSTYDYDDAQRVNLVDSLPRVDESTPLAFEVAEDARRRISLVGRPFPRPPRTRVLTVANQKGGVGKTTSTVNVAAAMAQSGLTVLVLDIDPQGNASTALGIDHHQEIPSLYDVVVEQRPLAEVLQSCPDIPNLLCAPATIDLAGAEIELVSLVARETRLQRALREYLDEREAQGQSRIDYVFVDCPPSLSLLTVNAFVAADEVFIPIQCEYYALEGLSQLLKHVELIRGHLNPTLHVSTILLTMYDGRTRLSSQVADEVRTHFPETVLRTSVPRSVRISEAPSHAQTVMTYDPASSGALSYLEAARELAEQVLAWDDQTHQQEERA